MMTPRRPHGVVPGYWERPWEFDPPSIHLPVGGCRWGPTALKSEWRELSPSLELVRDLGAYPCGSCFPREQGRVKR